jgi:hypothetical protein
MARPSIGLKTAIFRLMGRACDAQISTDTALQIFAFVHANVHNHCNQGHHLFGRQTYNLYRLASLTEWQDLMA